MFWHADVFNTILPDTFSLFVFGIQDHSQILRPLWWGPLNNIDIWVLFDLKKQEKSLRPLKEEKAWGEDCNQLLLS